MLDCKFLQLYSSYFNVVYCDSVIFINSNCFFFTLKSGNHFTVNFASTNHYLFSKFNNLPVTTNCYQVQSESQNSSNSNKSQSDGRKDSKSYRRSQSVPANKSHDVNKSHDNRESTNQQRESGERRTSYRQKTSLMRRFLFL